MAERSLSTEIQFLKGVGPRPMDAFRKAHLETVDDILRYVPRRYEDRRNLPSISSVQPGQWVTVRGEVVQFDSRPTRGGRVLVRAVIRDRSDAICLTWFNQPWLKRAFENYEGEIIAYGQVKMGSQVLEIASPEWEFVSEDDESEDFARIVPVYPLVEGLHQKVVRKAAKSAIEYYLDLVEEPFPKDFLRRHRLQGLRWSIRQLHQPESEEYRLESRRRLVFEEFFYMQLSLALRRSEAQMQLGISFPVSRLLLGEAANAEDALIAGPVKKGRETVKASKTSHLFASALAEQRDREPLWEQIHKMLPFQLTDAQQRVIHEIWSDMERPHPMNRLVQGDVGSGKTAVAACAILAAVRCGYQAAMMAPTEILAEQHAENLRRLFEPLGIEVELLVGKLSASQKRKAVARTAGHHADLVVGTHALIQEGLEFRRLGLVIVDEQHRFGVLQRKALRDKSVLNGGLGNPDVLVMTATPIPRTLTMTMYGDLDLSVIDQLPPGRRPIKTHWKLPFERDSVYMGVKKLIEEGRQAYFVCPMVSESEKMQAQAAEDLHYRLTHSVYPQLRVGLLHGQMKPREKEEVMNQFRAHELDILVSTTVIEVGVDVPNSSVMVIEDANRFGLSQLHQLRGRVGRGSAQSFCILIADVKGEEARERMEVMRETTDGFRIAEEDLRLRGPGDIAGTKQSGNLDFRIADLIQDSKLLEVARQAAFEVIEQDPTLESADWRPIRERLQKQRAQEALITIS